MTGLIPLPIGLAIAGASVYGVYKGISNTEWKGYGFKLENVEEIEPIQINGKLGLWDYEYSHFLPHGKFHISLDDIHAYSKFDIPTDVLKSMYSNLAWNQKGVFSKNYIISRYLEDKGITL